MFTFFHPGLVHLTMKLFLKEGIIPTVCGKTTD